MKRVSDNKTVGELARRIIDKIEADNLRALFLKYLTQSSETQDMRRKEFNQAIFDAEKGFACYNGTNLDMVMEKFDRAISEWVKQ